MGSPRTFSFHEKVINAMQGLNLKGNKGGVCAGMVLIYVIYASQNKDEDYRRLMDRIASDDYLKKAIRLKEKIQNAANQIRIKKENIRQPVADTRQKIVALTKSLKELKKPQIMSINTFSEELRNLNLKLLIQLRERTTHEYDLEMKENYLTIEEREILDTFPFLEWIDIIFQPQEYESFVTDFLQQTNIQELLDILQSESPHKSEVVYTDSKIYDETELKNYLNDLVDTFKQLEEKHLPIVMDNRLHRVGLKFEAKKEVWRLEDPNFSREVKKEDIASELIRAIFDDKPNKLDKVYTTFNLYIVSSAHSPSLQATKDALATFKQNHKITPDMLERETASKIGLEHIVKSAGDVDAIKQIAEFNKDFYQSAKAKNVFYFAAAQGHTKMFRWLKQNGVSLEEKDEKKINIFEIIAMRGPISILKEFKDDEFDINGIYGHDGARLTHIAASQGRNSFLRFLAESKPPADFKSLDSNGRNPLYYAGRNGHLATIHYLQEMHQLTFTKYDIEELSIIAAHSGYIDLLKLLIKQGLDLNVQDYFGETLVYSAISANQPEMINYLTTLDPNIIYQTNSSGDTPIFLAARLGRASIVKLLTQFKGYTLKEHPVTKDTLATFAVKQGFCSILKVLAEDNLLLSLENDQKMTPMGIAAEQSNQNCSLIFMPYYVSKSQLEEKEGTYIITPYAFYYVNKTKNQSISIPMPPENLDQLKKAFQAEKIELKENEKSRVLISALEPRDLELITNISEHGFGLQMVKVLLDALPKQSEKDEKESVSDLMILANEGDALSIEKLIAQFTPLELAFIAADQGFETIIKILAEQQLIDVNDTRDDDISQNTLACIAADKGHVSVIQTLKMLGADLNKRRDDKRNPLDLALFYEHAPLVKLLVEDIDLTKINPETKTSEAFTIAHKTTNPSILKIMIEEDKSIINQVDKLGRTLSYLATEDGNIDYLKVLIENGANLDIPNFRGHTPAYSAARKNDYYYETLKQLAHSGANFFNNNEERESAFSLLVKKGWIDILFIVLSHTIKRGDLNQLNEFIEYKIDLNTSDEYSHNAILLAIQHKQLAILNILSEQKNLNFKKQDCFGRSYAFIIAENGFSDAIPILGKLAEEKRIDLNQADQYGRTPAFIAAENGHLNTLKALAKLGVNLNQPDQYGLTPAMIAAQKGHLPIIEFLSTLAEQKENPPVNLNLLGSPLECNVLHIALRFDQQLIFETLLKNKSIDITLPDKDGRTLVEIAVQRKNVPAVRMLLSLGIDCTKVRPPANQSPLSIACNHQNWEMVMHILFESKECPMNLAINRQHLKNELIKYVKEQKNQETILYHLFNGCNALSTILIKATKKSNHLFKPTDDPILSEIIETFRLPLLKLLKNPDTRNAVSSYIQNKQGRLSYHAKPLKPSFILDILSDKKNDFLIDQCLSDNEFMHYIQGIIQTCLNDADPTVREKAISANDDFRSFDHLAKAYPYSWEVLKRKQ